MHFTSSVLKVSMFILCCFAFVAASMSITTEPTSNQTEMSWHRIFVYGTLKQGEPNHHHMINEQAVFIGPATTLQKWPLVIASKYNIPFLLHKEGTGNYIEGEVYSVNESLLSALDKLEGHPNFYERFQYNVTIKPDENNSTQTTEMCWIYILKSFDPKYLELPYHANYSSYGSHGLKYVASEKVTRLEDLRS